MCPGCLSECRMGKGRVVGVESTFRGRGLDESLWSTHSLTTPDISLLPKHCPCLPFTRSSCHKIKCKFQLLPRAFGNCPTLRDLPFSQHLGAYYFYIQHSMYTPLVISFLFKLCNLWKVQWYIVYSASRRSTKCFPYEDIILVVEGSLDKETGYILFLVLFWT